jgi:hypothetical protein
MENSRPIKFIKILFIGGTLFALPFFMLAYDDKTTHPALTQEMVELFNQKFQSLKVSDEDKELIIQGSIDEDLVPRWMQHFYDPVYNRGLTILGKKWMSSKEWAQNTLAQAGLNGFLAGTLTSYFSDEDDYSWGRAIYEYAWGNKKRGLLALGHILHLLEDATVPDHTRNDPHPPILNLGSPYEFWTKQFTWESFDFQSDIPLNLLSDLNSYFDAVAIYSNYNFFSKDTIFHKDYLQPTVEYYNGGLGFHTLDTTYPLVRIIKKFDNTIEYTLIDPEEKIMTAYWTRLSKQAVLHGAGVIKLFFDEVEKEKRTKTLYEKNRSWIAKAWDSVKEFFDGFAGLWFSIDSNNNINPSTSSGSNPSTNSGPSTSSGSNPSTALEESSAFSTGQAGSDPSTGPSTGPSTSSGSKYNEPIEVKLPTSTPQSVGTTIFLGNATSTRESKLPKSFTEPPYTMIGVEVVPAKAETNQSSSSTSSENDIGEPPIMPPDVSLTITECSSSLSKETCLIATTTITLEWQTSAENIDYYVLGCETEGFSCQDFNVSTTTATTTIYRAAEDLKTYTFKIKAVNKAGKESETVLKSLKVLTRPVVINEIAWAGTSANRPEDEWIELYNPSDYDIDITGWTLYSETNLTPYITLQGIIPAKGFFILERIDDTVISDINANQIYTGALNNNPLGEILVLSRASTTIDKTVLCSVTFWCGGEAGPSYYWTMERYDPYSSGEDPQNWGNWTSFLGNGKNADNLPIKGTPGKRNSINYLVDKPANQLNASKTLKKAQSPYVITGDFSVPAGKTLTLEPGVIIKFMSGSLIVNGTLKAEGAAGDPIIFTSFKDDSYGGDTNQDATSTSPLPGDWATIKILSDGSSFNRTVVRYGGAEDFFGQAWASIRVENSSVNIKDSIIEKAQDYGLWLKNSSGVIENNILRNNDRHEPGKTAGVGILVSGGNPVITRNQFIQNNFGLWIQENSTANVSENTFTNNLSSAILQNGAYALFSGNRAEGNGQNGISLQGAISEDYMLFNDLPYVITSNILPINNGATLSIAPGTIIKFWQGGLNVAGTLRAEGTEENKIIFTSLKDDEYGGDTNGDGSASLPQDGDWLQINFDGANPASIISRALIRYGGPSWIFSPTFGVIRIANTSLNISNSIMERNYRAGLWIENSTSTVISDSIIRSHQKPDTPTPSEPSYGIYLLNSSSTLKNNLFQNNKIGIRGIVSSVIDAGGNIFEGNGTNDDPSDLFDD